MADLVRQSAAEHPAKPYLAERRKLMVQEPAFASILIQKPIGIPDAEPDDVHRLCIQEANGCDCPVARVAQNRIG